MTGSMETDGSVPRDAFEWCTDLSETRRTVVSEQIFERRRPDALHRYRFRTHGP